MPYDLAKDLSDYECSSVQRQGWSGAKNGQLLRQAENSGFDLLITLDDDIAGEQTMNGRQISVLVLKPKRQGTLAVRQLAPEVRKVLAEIGKGQIRRVEPEELA